jgi:hypothetical protein
LVALAACSSPKGAISDAKLGDAVSIDSPSRPLDAHIDARPDARPDAPPDAAPPLPCMTAPTVLYDAAPRQIGNIARAGDTLYVSAYQVTNQQVSDPVIVPIDLTTGVAATPFVPAAATGLWPGDGDVYASEGAADGSIWRFHPGDAPAAVVTHRATPTAVTSAGGYVYWADAGGTIQRQSITGGTIEPVYACSPVRDLVVVGTDLYCVTGSSILRGLAAGGSTPDGLAGTDSYPILTMVDAGTTLYFINLSPFPELFKLPVFGSTAILASKLTTLGRYTGLALDGNELYIIAQDGLRRMDRTTFASQVVLPSILMAGDPVVWNSKLYFTEADPQQAGQRYVMHCVD